jgi:hypothetical protein
VGTCDLAWCEPVLGAAPWVLDFCIGVVVIWTIGIVDVQMRRLDGWRWLIGRMGYASAWVHERTCRDGACFLCSEWSTSDMANWQMLVLPESSAGEDVSLVESTYECRDDRDAARDDIPLMGAAARGRGSSIDRG